jgi:hypothetical protein
MTAIDFWPQFLFEPDAGSLRAAEAVLASTGPIAKRKAWTALGDVKRAREGSASTRPWPARTS